MDYWKEKIAVVTGASSGMGAAIALNLANAGVEVIGLARRLERMEELAEQVTGDGKIHPLECDVSKIDAIVEVFEKIDEMFGKVHILVNNAGRNVAGLTLDPQISHEEMLKTIDINLSGLVVCTREAYKLMQKHEDYCYIINMNSITGHMSPQIKTNFGNVYGATKHGIRNHTETIRLDLSVSDDADRIRVSSVSPGLVKTEILEAAGASQEFQDEFFTRNKSIEAKEVADAIEFLLSTPPNVNITELTIKPTGERL